MTVYTQSASLEMQFIHLYRKHYIILFDIIICSFFIYLYIKTKFLHKKRNSTDSFFSSSQNPFINS